MTFTYDGVPLLAMLDEYAMLRHEKEEEKKRLRVSSQVVKHWSNYLVTENFHIYSWQEQKKFQDQLSKEQEAKFGSTPSPARPPSARKANSPRGNENASRRLSLNTHQNGSRSTHKDGRRESRPVAPVNYVAIAKDASGGNNEPFANTS